MFENDSLKVFAHTVRNFWMHFFVFGACVSKLSKRLSKCLLRMLKTQKIEPSPNYFITVENIGTECTFDRNTTWGRIIVFTCELNVQWSFASSVLLFIQYQKLSLKINHFEPKIIHPGIIYFLPNCRLQSVGTQVYSHLKMSKVQQSVNHTCQGSNFLPAFSAVAHLPWVIQSKGKKTSPCSSHENFDTSWWCNEGKCATNMFHSCPSDVLSPYHNLFSDSQKMFAEKNIWFVARKWHMASPASAVTSDTLHRNRNAPYGCDR